MKPSEITYYFVGQDFHGNWKLFEYSGRPHGKGIRIERAGLELNCRTQVPTATLSMSPAEAKEQALAMQSATIAALLARLDKERDDLGKLENFQP
jgi:hypothetical protein